MTEILQPTREGLARAAADLRAGHPVVMPTETVYGLAADATQPDAIAAVFTAKARPSDDPLIVHVSPGLVGPDALAGLQRLGILASDLPPPQEATARTLMAQHWPGPLTLVLPRGPAIPLSVTSRLPAVAVRMPVHPIACALIDAAQRPLVAPSANLFGRISPTTAQAAFAELEGRIGLVLDGGPCEVGVESTVVRVQADGTIGLLRPGKITSEDLHSTSGHAPTRVHADEGTAGSPGRMIRHYAPTTALALVHEGPHAWSQARWDDLTARLGGRPLAYVAWSDTSQPAARLEQHLHQGVFVRSLTTRGEADEAAQHLYAVLRELDGLGAGLIVMEAAPLHEGLGEAIADRLSRAAHGTPPLAS